MKKIIFISLLALISITNSFGKTNSTMYVQSGYIRITGTVVDEDTGQPLSGVYVSTPSENPEIQSYGALTDMNGNFELIIPIDVFCSNFYLKFKLIGYFGFNLDIDGYDPDTREINLGTVTMKFAF